MDIGVVGTRHFGQKNRLPAEKLLIQLRQFPPNSRASGGGRRYHSVCYPSNPTLSTLYVLKSRDIVNHDTIEYLGPLLTKHTKGAAFNMQPTHYNDQHARGTAVNGGRILTGFIFVLAPSTETSSSNDQHNHLPGRVSTGGSISWSPPK